MVRFVLPARRKSTSRLPQEDTSHPQEVNQCELERSAEMGVGAKGKRRVKIVRAGTKQNLRRHREPGSSKLRSLQLGSSILAKESRMRHSTTYRLTRRPHVSRAEWRIHCQS